MEMAAGRGGLSEVASLVCLHLGSSVGKLGLPVLERLHRASWMWLGSLWSWSPGLLEWHGVFLHSNTFSLFSQLDHHQGQPELGSRKLRIPALP